MNFKLKLPHVLMICFLLLCSLCIVHIFYNHEEKKKFVKQPKMKFANLFGASVICWALVCDFSVFSHKIFAKYWNFCHLIAQHTNEMHMTYWEVLNIKMCNIIFGEKWKKSMNLKGQQNRSKLLVEPINLHNFIMTSSQREQNYPANCDHVGRRLSLINKRFVRYFHIFDAEKNASQLMQVNVAHII